MTDQPDYTTANPRLMIGGDPEKDEMPEHSIPMNIYKEDGSPNFFQEPSKEDVNSFIDKFMSIAGDMDVREVLYHLSGLSDVITGAVHGAIMLVHAQAHIPDRDDGLEEHTLCHGVGQYLKPRPDGEINSDTVGEHVLSKFFPDKDQKPH